MKEGKMETRKDGRKEGTKEGWEEGRYKNTVPFISEILRAENGSLNS
jgi:predicted transposase YdaD